MALGTILQDDFSTGIVRSLEGQRIPRTGVYDLVNGITEEDLGVYRRGGSAYLSTSDFGEALEAVWSGVLAAGDRTLGLGLTLLKVWDSGWVHPASNTGTAQALANGRPVVINGYFNDGGHIYAGSLKTSDYATGTVAVSGTTVTGTGTAWSANVDAGMIFRIGGTYGIVSSVGSNTGLTLRDPWPSTVGAGSAYELAPQFLSAGALSGSHMTVAGQRLLNAAGDAVYFSSRLLTSSTDWAFAESEDYHLIPGGHEVTGLEGIGDAAFVFTTGGTWVIRNLAYDLTDDYGNPQQTAQAVAPNLILWDERGISSYRGSVVVPAIDDVYLLSLGGEPVPVSEAIRPLYRSYVKAGYQAGFATVHRAHYFLPIMNGSTLVDVLVCRLDGGSPAWGRWSGHAAGAAYVEMVGSSSRSPKLYGISGQRITDLSGCFAPVAGNKNDADGSTHVLSVVTRDFALRPQVRNLWRYLRARFQLDDAASDNPTLTLESSAGPPESEVWVSSGSWAEGTGEDSSKIAILNSDGNPGRRVQSIRFRIRSSGPAARLVLRSLEVFYRASGRL